MEETTLDFVETQPECDRKVNEINADKIASPVIARLIEEVRKEEAYSINAYNRMHNRHNRSR